MSLLYRIVSYRLPCTVSLFFSFTPHPLLFLSLFFSLLHTNKHTLFLSFSLSLSYSLSLSLILSTQFRLGGRYWLLSRSSGWFLLLLFLSYQSSCSVDRYHYWTICEFENWSGLIQEPRLDYVFRIRLALLTVGWLLENERGNNTSNHVISHGICIPYIVWCLSGVTNKCHLY